MKSQASALLAVAALALSGPSVQAESSVAITAVDMPAQTDTRVSVPVTRQPVGEFEVAPGGVSGNTVTLDGAAFAGDQFPLNSQGNPLFYVRFTSGDLEGRWFNIAGHGSNSVDLNVEDTGDPADLSAASEGDTLTIYPHWTIETVFDGGLAGYSFDSSPNPFQPTFSVLVPDNAGVGTNRPTSATVFFFNGQWIRPGGTSAGDTVIAPQRTLVIRNDQPADAGEADDPGTLVDESTNDLVFLARGGVPALELVEQVRVESVANDTAITAGNLEAVKVSDLNLANVIDSSPNPFQPTDVLLFFPDADSANGFDVPTSTTVFRFGGQFVFPGGTPAADFEVGPGEVFILRKAGGTPGSIDWTIPSP